MIVFDMNVFSKNCICFPVGVIHAFCDVFLGPLTVLCDVERYDGVDAAGRNCVGLGHFRQ